MFRGLTVCAVLTALLVSWSWPRPETDGYVSTNWNGSLAVALLLAFAGGLTLFVGLRSLWERHRPGGDHWQDRWQARQGDLVDLVLSGVTFPANALHGLQGSDLAKGGLGLVGHGAGIANVPMIGGFGGPLALVGVAAMAVGAVVGIGQAAVQSRRDEAVTRVFRGEARQQLLTHLADLESTRAVTRGRHLSRLEVDVALTQKAIAAIERAGFTVPTP